MSTTEVDSDRRNIDGHGRINKRTITPKLILDSIEDEGSLSEVFDLSSLINVIELSIRYNNLSHLPENFASNLSNVTRIDLSRNNLQELGASFEHLPSLQELILDNNELRTLPNNLEDSSELKLLGARQNRLTSVPESIGNLVKLEFIDFSGNNLKTLPESMVKLINIKTLNLASNHLKDVPKCVYEGTSKLEVLDLSENHISEFETAPCSNNLKQLHYASNSKNRQFPEWLFSSEFSTLEELSTDNTVFTSYEVPVKRVDSNLKRLSMVDCGLSDTTFDQIVRFMPKLEQIDVGHRFTNSVTNLFWLMPCQSFENPERLIEFNIREVGLPALPTEINVLRNLQKLNVSRNNLSWLPDEICELQKLEVFDASFNSLYAMPDPMHKMIALRVLLLENNKFSNLPETITRLENLELLDLYDNELSEIPKQIEGMTNLKAVDVDRNCFETNEMQLSNINYPEARKRLRTINGTMSYRYNQPKVLDERVDRFSDSSSESDIYSDKGVPESHVPEIVYDAESSENWDDSDDMNDKFDPTVSGGSRNYRHHSPFIPSSYMYYGNFCPADLHNLPVRDQLAILARDQLLPTFDHNEGQFDDA